MKQRAPRSAEQTPSPRPAGEVASPLSETAEAAAGLGDEHGGPEATPMLDAAAMETTLGGSGAPALGGSSGATPMDGTGGVPALTITSETAWAAQDGSASSRTSVGPKEMIYFTASDEGGTWSSSGGSGIDAGGIYNWTAPGRVGSYTVTYRKGTRTASKTIRVVPPTGFSVISNPDQSFSGGQGAGMDVNLRVLPTQVSFGGIEIMEQVGTVAGNGYFTGRTIPHDPEPWAGVSETNETGPDDASFSGWPSPWREGTMTWTIPTEWRPTGGTSAGVFTTSTQDMRIHDTTGRSSVSKFRVTSSERTP